MADVAAIVPKILAKKPRNGGRKALKQKDVSLLINEANIAAQELLPEPSESVPVVEKENRGSRKKGKSKAADKGVVKEGSIEELMELMERMRIEKERTEEMLKEKDEILRKKDEEKESLRVELRKLQKLKEFKPTLV